MRLIDADAMLARLEEWNTSDSTDKALYNFTLHRILEQPTIEPRKKGKWIEQDDSWDGVYYECSACGEPWTTIDGTPWDNGMHFCPNCGAEMTEGEG